MSHLRRIPSLILLLGVVALSGACYDESTAPPAEAMGDNPDSARSATESPGSDSGPPAGPQPTGVSTEKSSEPPPAAQAATIKVIMGRLSRNARQQSTTAPDRDASWRVPELEKLRELLTSCCKGDEQECQRCLAPIARENLTPDELWPLVGQFLGPLRPHARVGFLALGAPLLTHKDGEVRDRSYRMAVGAGVSRRGQPDDMDRRASSVPLVPRLGEPLWLVVEQLSPCPTLSGDVKGPDTSGRLDVALTDHCTPEDWREVTSAFPPRATRGVWGIFIDTLPMGGLSLWMAGAEQPLLRVRDGLEARSPGKPETTPNVPSGP